VRPSQFRHDQGPAGESGRARIAYISAQSSRQVRRMISRRRALSLAFLSTLLAIGSSPGAEAVSEAAVDATLRDFHWRIGGSRELATRAAAVLVFPTIIKAGFGIGGEYGEGACSFMAGRSPSIIAFGVSAGCTGEIAHYLVDDRASPRRLRPHGWVEGRRRRFGSPDNRWCRRLDRHGQDPAIRSSASSSKTRD
jgi:hypothetical protein